MVLIATPRPVPFSYSINGLQRGRFTKELLTSSKRTINLGEAGEVIVDYFRKSTLLDHSFEYKRFDLNSHCLVFNATRLGVQLHVQQFRNQSWLPGVSSLSGVGLKLTIEGDAIDRYTLGRHLGEQLKKRYRRGDWVDEQFVSAMGHSAAKVRSQWQRLLRPIADFACQRAQTEPSAENER